jgi:hypothetical protein
LELPGSYRIEPAPAQLSEELAGELVRFAVRRSDLPERQLRSRVSEVVCLLRDGEGEIAGSSAVTAGDVPMLAGRRLWIYRTLLSPEAPEEARQAMLRTVRDSLERDFVAGGRSGPIGLCVPIADPVVIAQYPEAWWEESRMLYAGYTVDDVQVRVSYFDGARV